MLQKFLTALVVIGIAVWVISQPAVAGDTVRSVISGIITFFQHAGA